MNKYGNSNHAGAGLVHGLLHGIARNTARQAIRLLAESGLVVAEHGRGVFVRPAIAVIRLGNDRYSPRYRETGLSPFLLECAKQGKAGRFQVLSVERVTPLPPADVATRLKISPDSPSALRRENVFWADTDPGPRLAAPLTAGPGRRMLSCPDGGATRRGALDCRQCQGHDAVVLVDCSSLDGAALCHLYIRVREAIQGGPIRISHPPACIRDVDGNGSCRVC